ncbi:MAG: cation:proton antiporter [Bacilli bacterium]|nr:cation:proton antiporter [Bacilli bacterium]
MIQLLSTAEATTTYEALLLLAFILMLGLFAGRWFEKIKLPHITGYISMGVLLGIILTLFGIGFLIDSLVVISSVALGFIAYGIGSELRFNKLKKSGKEVVVITVIQAFMAAVFTIFGLLVIKVDLPIALVLGAIATATAPAPIMLLTRKYRCKGELTDVLLPIVGLDDAVGIVLFGVLLSISTSLRDGVGLSINEMLLGPTFELLNSIVVGLVVGIVVSVIVNLVNSKDYQKEEIFLGISIFAVFVTVALSNMGIHFGDYQVHLSPILTPMIMGVTITNSISVVRSQDMLVVVEKFTNPIMIVFFTLAGAELVVAFVSHKEADFLAIAGITGIYVVFRAIGKILGSNVGSRMMKSHPNVRKYLGICLLPQAGVALGMAYQARTDFGEEGITILIVVLIATLVYELFGPIGVKYSLFKSNEMEV